MNAQIRDRTPTSHGVEGGSIPKGILVRLGTTALRLFVLIFFKTGPNLLSKQTISYAASQSVPFASFAVPIAGVLALAGSVSVLLGFRTKIGASLIALFLIPVTLMMHKFWTVHDAGMAQMQMVMFMKNLAIGRAWQDRLNARRHESCLTEFRIWVETCIAGRVLERQSTRFLTSNGYPCPRAISAASGINKRKQYLWCDRPHA